MRQMQRTKNPTAAIVIVTYNGAQFIQRCLTSVQQQSYPKEYSSIIIVDNASTDDTRNIIEDSIKEKNTQNLTLIKNTQNWGFGEANNIGIKNAPPVDYIVLLNQDTWVEINWLEELVRTMEKNPAAGCCGAAEHPYNETLVISKEQKASTKAGCWMGGGSMILRKKALDAAGLFDDIYFMYGEDMDLTWRLQIVGYTIIMNNKAIWHHYGRKRNDQTMGWRVYYSWRNRIFLLIKFGSREQIFSSLWKYAHYFILGKRRDTLKSIDERGGEMEKEDQKNSKKILIISPYTAWVKKLFFSIKLCCAIIWYLPCILQRRMKMKSQRIDYAKTDAWIQETDMQLYEIN